MPELPEVEVTRRSFADRIAAAKILALHMGKPLRWPLGLSPQGLVGRQVLGVRRRGKYLLLDLDQGLLLLHLGMSGSLNFASTQPEAGPHDHMDLVTDKGVLRLHDPRRFGAVVFAQSEDADVARKLLGRLGMEPLSDGFKVQATVTNTWQLHWWILSLGDSLVVQEPAELRVIGSSYQVLSNQHGWEICSPVGFTAIWNGCLSIS